MNTFNRIVVVLVLLALIPLLTILFITPHTILVNIGDRLMSFGYNLGGIEQPILRLAGGILLALIFDALAIFLIVLELKPKRKRYIQVQEIDGGMATISADSIVQQLEYALDPLPGIIKVNPKVSAKRDKVQAMVEVLITPGSNVPETATNLVEVVRKVLTSDLGLRVAGDPQVRIKVAAPDKRAAPPKAVEPAREPEVESPEPEPESESREELPVWAGRNPEDHESRT